MLDGANIPVWYSGHIGLLCEQEKNTAFHCTDSGNQGLKLQKHEPTGGHFVILSDLVWIRGSLLLG
jgi:hypothetical protein